MMTKMKAAAITTTLAALTTLAITTLSLTTPSIAAAAALSATAPLAPPFPLAAHPERNNGKTECDADVPAPVTSLDLSSIYADGDATHSTIDPEHKRRYDAALKATRGFASFVARWSNTYTQSDGKRLDAAACA